MPPGQLAAHLSHLSFPVVAKPESCAGSFCVLRCDDAGEVADAADSFWERWGGAVCVCVCRILGRRCTHQHTHFHGHGNTHTR